mmetsp:Transcript_90681/g.256052  ORF Transcript_90681/g.256052 Transcript_90681/m.256052 type:complete len:183 (+) Transcript_90681:105-653(+)
MATKVQAERSERVPCQIHPEAVVCSDSKLLGPAGIKIGEGTVVHPTCMISALGGPIEIGKFNIFEEQVEIINNDATPLCIGNHNIFEVGAKFVSGGGVGNANIFECQSRIGAGTQIGDGCTLGIKAVAPDGEQLPDETVIVGPSGMRHIENGAKESHIQAIMKHIDVLKETLPRCHHLKKSK